MSFLFCPHTEPFPRPTLARWCGEPTKPPAQWPTRSAWKNLPDQRGNRSREEALLSPGHTTTNQLDLELSCPHFTTLFSLPPGGPLLHSLGLTPPGLGLGWGWGGDGGWPVQVEESSLEWWESSASEVRQTCVLLLAPLLLAV